MTEQTDLVPSELSPSLQRIYAGLPEEYKTALVNIAKKANPKKKGLSDEGNSSSSWHPTAIRINQPTTRNTGGLEDLKPGEMFTGIGDKLGDKMEFIILYRFVTHTRWNAGEFEGSPNCSSPGQLPGEERLSVYGTACDACPDLPFRDGTRTNCNKNMVYWVLEAGSMSNIYAIQFSKTSYKEGTRLYRLAKSQPSAWSRKYTLSVEKISNKNGVYYAFKVGTGGNTDEHQRAIADGFYDVINESRSELLHSLKTRAESQQEAPVEGVNIVMDETAEPEFNI